MSHKSITVTVIKIVVSKQQFERPKWPFETQDRHKLVHISTALGYERTSYQHCSLYLVIFNQIFDSVWRFYHIIDLLYFNVIFPQAFTKILPILSLFIGSRDLRRLFNRCCWTEKLLRLFISSLLQHIFDKTTLN